MGSSSDNPPLIVIVGETASGKTALAIRLAQQFHGEIIAADSRTIYRGMDISTAKPSPAECLAVPHHMLNVVKPDETFTAADFQRQAKAVIADVASRGSLPFLVGGTGLYIDAVIYDFSFSPPPSASLRAQLQALNVAELQALIIERNLPMPENSYNPRHLIRTLERAGQVPQRHALRPNTLIIGLAIDREDLRRRITTRADAMLSQGFAAEIRHTAQTYGWDAPALQVPGGKAFRQYFAGELSIVEAREQLIRDHLRLAKRQRTWFRRNNSIQWVAKQTEAVDLVTTFLNKYYL